MTLILYKKQRQILDFIKQFIQSNGSAPTLKHIADAIGVTSLATVHEHLGALEEKGLLKRKHGKSRSIELTQTDVGVAGDGFEAPILGFIAAGQPIEPYTDPNATMNIPSAFVSGKKRTYVLQVRGQSMIEDHINDGDYVVIEQTESAKDGEIVVALLDNGMATLKRFFKEATRIRLQPANSTMQPIFVKNVRIQGKVVGLVRKYKN
jgi:repressor LexA